MGKSRPRYSSMFQPWYPNGTPTGRVGWKIHFLGCLWELNNLLLSAVSSALHLPMVPFGCTHILVLSDDEDRLSVATLIVEK